MKIEHSSGNIYADLGHADAAGMQIKAQLVDRIGVLIRRRELSQRAAAGVMGISQSLLSNVLRGQFRGVSEYKLLECLRLLGNDVRIVIEPVKGKAVRAGVLSVHA